jgi:uncharacterized protein (TIGR00297 family)
VSHLQSALTGAALASVIAVIAWRADALRASGAIAAIGIGTAAMAAGWDWGILVVLYFVSSSALSRFRGRDKDARTAGRVEKTGARDAWQVMANGALFALSAVMYAREPRPLWQLTAIGALAASAADTWATELGVLSPAPPRSILTRQPVEPGVSGGVSVLGFAGAVAAASLIAIAAGALGWPSASLVAALLGGLGGCVLDSVLGAALQSRRRCPACGVATEQRVHRCGTATLHTGGMAALDNDGVNFLATAGGAAIGVAVAMAVT